MKYVLPLVVFLVMAGSLLDGLDRDPGLLPSVLLDKAAPAFDTDRLFPEKPTSLESALPGMISSDALKGEVWVLNIWASWCEACIGEHPLVKKLAEQTDALVVGLNYKDTDAEARRWLQRFGNPYALVAVDQSGSIGIDYGVYGVPETFIVDRQGVIRYKHIGPIDAQALDDILLPKIRELLATNA